jgi:hypothetical protein
MTHLGQAQVRERIAQRILALNPDSPALWGKMNAAQMQNHLSDSYLIPLGERSASPADNVIQRTLVKWAALYLPAPWPKGVPTRPEIDQAAGGGTPPADFFADRAKLLALIDKFCSVPPAFPWSPHPIFGRLSTAQWLRWGYLHADHHLRQFGM